MLGYSVAVQNSLSLKILTLMSWKKCSLIIAILFIEIVI